MTRAAPCFTVFLLILTFVSALMLPAQEVLLPEEESPSSFYDTDIDSEDVSLFLSGSWKVNLSASAGFGFSPESGFNEGLSYPGISSGLTFSQSPDITVSLLILEKILFEAAFTDNFDDSTFRLGYIGGEDEFVRLVSAGNMEINLTEDTGMSDFFYIPGGGPSSFGLHSLFAGPFSEHELLFRFDPQEELHKLYIGSDILVEIVRQPSDYLRGRVFYLPAAPDDAVFYIETGAADASVN
ncbi:MAG TPA: hypothetical protein DCO79_00485, partial [Spirochaeta sp.]|nr:hypothetical protein [Spirochaeta sp.]